MGYCVFFSFNVNYEIELKQLVYAHTHMRAMGVFYFPSNKSNHMALVNLGNNRRHLPKVFCCETEPENNFVGKESS